MEEYTGFDFENEQPKNICQNGSKLGIKLLAAIHFVVPLNFVLMIFILI